MCSFAPAAFAAAIVESRPATPLRMWLCAVADHHPIGLFRLPVLVKIDEAGGDDVIRRVDDTRAVERRLRHRGDLPRRDADMANAIEPGFGIDDAAVRDDQVVRARFRTGGE